MSIFSRLFGRGKVKVEPVVIETKPAGCEHDWVRVEEGQHIRQLWSHYDGTLNFGRWRRRDGNLPPGGFELSRRSVCLNCGECVDTIAEAESEIVEREAEEARRKELAAKMWEDCKGVK